MVTFLQVDKKLLNTVKGSIRQGFSWATREGPLCEERKCLHFSCFVPGVTCRSCSLQIRQPTMRSCCIGHAACRALILEEGPEVQEGQASLAFCLSSRTRV